MNQRANERARRMTCSFRQGDDAWWVPGQRESRRRSTAKVIGPAEGWLAAVGLPASTFGLNALQAYYQEDGVVKVSSTSDAEGSEDPDRYAAAEQIFEDCHRLGASVVRHPGRHDLTWERLTGSQDTLVPFTEAEIRDLICTEKNIAAFADMLAEVWSQKLKIRLTFMTYGGGASNEVTVIPNGYTSCVYLRWDAKHAICGDRNPFIVDVGGGKTMFSPGAGASALSDASFLSPEMVALVIEHDSAWNILDVRLSYDRQFVGKIAGVVAELLLLVLERLREKIHSSFSLDYVVDAIEIFNEVDIRNIIWWTKYDRPKADVSARYWAKSYANVAKAFQDAFKGAGETCPPLVLPAMSSYGLPKWYKPADAGSASMLTWKYRIEWLQEFLAELATHEDAEHPLSEMADGMDYHWYHRDNKPSSAKDTIVDGETYVDVLHIAHLVDEVNRIRDAFDDVGLLVARLSVFESGISTKDADRIKPKTESGESDVEIPPYSGVGGDRVVDESYAFQAQEVIRRLLGALAGSVATAGWHSWMSSSNGNFINMGLRIDTKDFVVDPIQATQRTSWYAFKRLEHVAGKAVITQLLIPDLSAFSAGETGLDEWEPSDWDDAIVFELALSAGRTTRAEFKRYVYVMMVDPWRGKVKSLCIEFDPSVTGQIAFRHQFSPSGLGAPESGGEDDDLEVRNGEYPLGDAFTVAGTVSQILTAGFSPVLLSSDSRLVNFKVVDCPVSEEVVELDMDEFEVIVP